MTRTILTALALALTLGACSPDSAAEADTTTVATDDEAIENEAAEMEEDGEENTITPPAAVSEAFQAEHPEATDVEWTQEEGGYEASFMEDGEEMSVVYMADGTAGAVETEIAVADLPAAVTEALARDHADARVTEAARIVEGDDVTYEAEIMRDGRSQDLLFREDGTLVGTETDDA